MAFQAHLADWYLATLVGTMVVHETVETEAEAAQMSHTIIHVGNSRQNGALMGLMLMPTDSTFGLLLLGRRFDETFGV